MKLKLLIILCLCLLLFTSCTQSYTDTQLDALSRVDPVGFLTDNHDFFEKYTKDTILTAKDTFNPAHTVTFLDDGRMQTKYYGTEQLATISYAYRGNGDIISVVYYFRNDLGNTFDAIENYETWLTQMENDFITIFGDNYRSKSSIEQFVSDLENGNRAKYTIMYGSNENSLIVNVNPEENNQSIDIMIFLAK